MAHQFVMGHIYTHDRKFNYRKIYEHTSTWKPQTIKLMENNLNFFLKAFIWCFYFHFLPISSDKMWWSQGKFMKYHKWPRRNSHSLWLKQLEYIWMIFILFLHMLNIYVLTVNNIHLKWIYFNQQTYQIKKIDYPY